MKLAAALPKSTVGRAVANQLVRSGTSVGANYRAACRSRSKAEFASRLAVADEEADESGYWMELIAEAGLMDKQRVAPLLQEANELTAILTASRETALGRRKGR